MDEHLLAYLLDTLDPAMRERVEEHLRTNPDAQARLEQLEAALAPLAEDRDDLEPPPGLVFATLARLAEHQCRKLPSAPLPSRRQVGSTPWRLVRRPDLLVAAALLLLAGGLFTSLLAQQWRSYYRLACVNNLRQIWGGLEAYADRNEGAFPQIEAEGPRAVAGAFAPILRDAGVLQNANVSCSTTLASTQGPASLADLETLYREQPEQFRAAARDLAGGYAYSLGYRDGQQHHGLTRSSGETLPILADCPPPDGRGNSLNHGGTGQNVLYVGGNVRWCALTTVGENGDDIYLNQRFQVRAGLQRSDTVLGAGDASPYRPE